MQKDENRVMENPGEHSGEDNKVRAGDWIKKFPLSLLTTVPTVELHPCIDQESSGWRRVRSVMDSGASESVQHPDEIPEVEVQPSPGSRIG